MAKYFILSIDGGGVRGIIPARILQEIEQRAGKSIYQLFNLMVGNSTGGLIVMALAAPDSNSNVKYKAKDIVKLYIERSKDIFNKSIWRRLYSGMGLWGAKYSRNNLDSILADMFGDTLLSKTLTPILAPSYSINEGFNRLWSTRTAKIDQANNAYLRDIAGATSSAPTYFPPKELKNIKGKITYEADGGIFANNPSMLAIAEAYKEDPTLKREDILLVSIGTGKITLNHTAHTLKDSGVIGWVLKDNLIDIMLNAGNEVTEWEALILGKTATRIQLNIPVEVNEMDNSSEENLNELLQITEQYIVDNSQIIDKLCDQLKNTSN